MQKKPSIQNTVVVAMVVNNWCSGSTFAPDFKGGYVCFVCPPRLSMQAPPHVECQKGNLLSFGC